MLIKLSASCLAAVGAKSAEEFPDRLAALLTSTTGYATAIEVSNGKIATLEKLTGELKTSLETSESKIKAQAGEIAALEKIVGNPATLTEAKIKEIATIAGSQEAAKAVGATGLTPPAPAAQAGAAATGSEAFNALLKSGKYEEAFAAAIPGSEVRKEFSDAKSYAAFMKMNSRGQVKITGQRN